METTNAAQTRGPYAIFERHTPEVADGPFIASCSCGWHATAIAPASDGGPEWVAHVIDAERRWNNGE